MSNYLSMANIQSIETLHRAGHSNRKIARLLGIDRGAVNKYVQRLRAAEAPPSLPDPATADSQSRPDLHMPLTERRCQVAFQAFPDALVQRAFVSNTAK